MTITVGSPHAESQDETVSTSCLSLIVVGGHRNQRDMA
jgi:hypothetical protein